MGNCCTLEKGLNSTHKAIINLQNEQDNFKFANSENIVSDSIDGSEPKKG